MATQTTATTTVKVTGNTYPARDVLRTAGFAWSKDGNCWLGDDAAKAELERITTATYSRRNAKACSGIIVTDIA
jgi:hypothetical protein